MRSPIVSEDEVTQLIRLTGGYPSLLKAATAWHLAQAERPALEGWTAALLANRSVKYRLDEIWQGLTQEEQLALVEVYKAQRYVDQTPSGPSASQPAALTKAGRGLEVQHAEALAHLAAKGLCQRTASGWQIFCELMAGYLGNLKQFGSGKIWLDETTGELYQNQSRLPDLAPLERAALRFFVLHPKIRHTKTDIIVNAWPSELREGTGVADDSLYQVIMALRKKIEPNPAKPCYLVTWRGTTEGGYQFFPEGRPE